MNIKLVVFDIAGTTVADKGNINETFCSAFLKAGITVEAKDVDEVMGYRKIEAVKILFEKYSPGVNNSSEFINTIHDDFTKEMVAFYEKATDLRPLPYAEETFKILQNKNIKVALNTGFTRKITEPILKKLGWDNADFINATVCSDEVEEGRPHPFMIKKIMQLLNIQEAGEVAKVGDTEVDVKEGHNSGCGLTVAVTTGAYTKQQLQQYKPDYIIDSLQEFPALISN